MQSNQTFFNERMKPLGLTEENNRMKVVDPLAEHPTPSSFETEIFSYDKDGNIKILYWMLNRGLIKWDREDRKNHNLQTYIVKRLAQPTGDKKYEFPTSKSGLLAQYGQSTFPWIYKTIVEKWEQKDKITTLFLTEGVFKAYAACIRGMDVIGLGSITHYADGQGELYADLQRIIIDCQVENVVVLWDGDCLNISENALARRENISKRPMGFYVAAKKIRKLVGNVELPGDRAPINVFFYHIKPESFMAEKPKGLDDLLLVADEKGKTDSVVTQSLDPKESSLFFYKMDITSTTRKLYEYFALKEVEKFYVRHSNLIGTQEFRFFDDLYKYNDSKEELELIAPKWAEELYWVGNEFFIEIDMPSVGDTTRKELAARTQTTLTKLHGPKFWRYLSHFDGFCNVPHHRNYQQVIESKGKKFYNQYFPFMHTAQPGGWPHIELFMKHIFGEDLVTHGITGEEIPRWKMGVDYVQLLYKKPTQMLPVLILYSPENKTGKSTFGLLMAKIFGDNVVPIGNSDLQSDFNSTYSSKLLAVCEETLLERKKEAERIKAISTSPRILVNPKGQAQYMIDFFCKFIFTSNNPRMIYVNRHDTRYWIIQVPQLKQEIPNFLQLMEAEIPAFLHHLETREMVTQKEGRMHFHDSLLATDAFDQTVRINEPSDATELRERIGELFLKDENLKELQIPLSGIREEFFGKSTQTKWLRELLKDYLLVEQVMGHNGKAKVKRGTYPRWTKNVEGELVQEEIHYLGRPYRFKREDFVTDIDPADYKEMELEMAGTTAPPKAGDDDAPF